MARILIVEDDEETRSVVRRILLRAGHDIVEAVDGADGIDAFIREKVDLVVTDLIMPELDGTEVVRHIRELDPTVPVIAISGAIEQQTKLTVAIHKGATVRLAKPFLMDDLLTLVEALLGPGDDDAA